VQLSSSDAVLCRITVTMWSVSDARVGWSKRTCRNGLSQWAALLPSLARFGRTFQ